MLGPQDLWIALALGVFFFGSKKLPELSRSVGQAMTEFRKGLAAGAPDEPGSLRGTNSVQEPTVPRETRGRENTPL